MFPEWSAKQLFEFVSADELSDVEMKHPSAITIGESIDSLNVQLVEKSGRAVTGKDYGIEVAGIVKFYPDFVDVGDDWEALFASSPILDVAIMYGACMARGDETLIGNTCMHWRDAPTAGFASYCPIPLLTRHRSRRTPRLSESSRRTSAGKFKRR